MIELGGVGADAVVAAHDGRRAAAGDDEPHAGAVDRRAGLRIEHEAERVDDGRGCRLVGGVERVGVGSRELAVALHLQHAVADGHGGGAGLHVARKAARVDGRLVEHDGLAVAAGGRDGELDAVDDRGIAIAIGVDELEEHGFTAMHRRRRAELQRLAERKRLAVAAERRRQRLRPTAAQTLRRLRDLHAAARIGA